MADAAIPWAPRVLMTGRTFRLPVQTQSSGVKVQADGFSEISRRHVPRDGAEYLYLRAPGRPGDYTLTPEGGKGVEVEVDLGGR